MSAFDQVIGYESIKKDLLQLCDMVRNPEIYREMGAVLPRGVLLYGDPGLGKTLMADALIRETGLTAFRVRMNAGENDIVTEINETFRKAAECAPCIVFLDDLDKYANEDSSHQDAAAYVTVQACIDDVKDEDVFVIATANNHHKLPASLCRPGRFDREIEFEAPGREDALRIIRYYLRGKKVDESVDLEDLSRMLDYESCAALETILNEAAIYAAYERKGKIGMPELIRAVLRKAYDSPETDRKISEEKKRKIALHEAGHAVISEALIPGSVGMVSIWAAADDDAGLMHSCVGRLSLTQTALIALGGKAATEMYYPDRAAKGCADDIMKASTALETRITNEVSLGFGLTDIKAAHYDDASPYMIYKEEVAVQAELERRMFQVRGILMKNRLFLERMTDELIQKGTLLYSDVQRIKASVVSFGEEDTKTTSLFDDLKEGLQEAIIIAKGERPVKTLNSENTDNE